MGKLYGFILFLLVIIGSACNKTDMGQNGTPIDSTKIFGSIDSSDLIKSITYQNQDSSYTQYFYYDTVNLKIIVSQQPVLTATQDYTDGEEFSYDAQGYLTHITGKFTAPQDVYFSSADYQYDDQHILKSASTNYFGGLFYSANYTKTPIVSGGYILSELYTLPGNNGYTDSNYSAVYISDSDRYISSIQLHNYTDSGDAFNTSPNGDTYDITTDTVIYDAAGNYVKSMMTFPPDPLKLDSLITITTYDFVRDTRGDQLYKLARVLFHGVDNTIFPLMDFYTGMLSSHGEIGIQLYKYPALQTKYTDSYVPGIYTIHTFNTPAEYDSQSRLVKYHNFAHYAPYAEYDIVINYYK